MGAGKDAVVEFVKAINANDEVKGMLKNWVKNACYKLEGEDGPFWVESGERVRVPMMSKTYEYRRSVEP